jgi:L-lactate dehydrogenase complex protein LldF
MLPLTVGLLGGAALTVLAAALWHARGTQALAARDFRRRYHKALRDPRLAGNLLGFQRAWRPARAAALQGLSRDFDYEALRSEMAAVKDAVIRDLPEHFARFRAGAEAAGAVVVEAGDAEAACQYVAELARRRGARLAIKSKSMVGEEIELNPYLEAQGLEVVETDLGEWIVQLAGERPSHMVMPAIHKSRQQVGELFSRVLGRPVSREAIPEQVGVARAELRQKFLAADIGISGANALIAESGAVMLVTNEGNGRLVTTLPPVHVVLVGYEKLVPAYGDAVRQLRLLARNATAQHLTSYTTFIRGPDRPDKELHIVLVDNGRFAMRADPTFREALRCIRCGACANVCPPYQVVGGHVFGHIYTGAIGLVNTPFHHGLEHAAGPQSLCVSCNACATVCPVGIPLPQQILAVRARVAERLGLPAWKRAALAIWARPAVADAVSRLVAHLSAPLIEGGMLRRLPLPAMWRWRTLPAPARVPARDRLARRAARKRLGRGGREPGPPGRPPAQALEAAATPVQRPLEVACFMQCVADRLCPEVMEATVRALEASGARVVIPAGQHCCGLPALDAGDTDTARRMARQTITTLESTTAEYVVTPGASCVVAMAHEYENLFAPGSVWHARAQQLRARVVDLTTFLARIAPLEAEHRTGRETSSPADGSAGPSSVVTYHPFCQSRNVLGLDAAPRGLLEGVLGLEVRELPEADVCCGFGGWNALDHPEVAQQIAARKLANAATTGAPVLVTDNPGCVLHLRGAARAAGMPIRVVHVAEVIAERLGLSAVR